MKHTEINIALSVYTVEKTNSYSSSQTNDLLLVTILVKLQKAAIHIIVALGFSSIPFHGLFFTI